MCRWSLASTSGVASRAGKPHDAKRRQRFRGDGPCAYCWLKNTENTVDYNNNTGGVLNVNAGFRDQFEGVYSHLTAAANSGGGNYEWGINMDSTEILVENSISMLADKVMVVRQSGAGSVFAYNYYDDCVLEDSAVGETEVGMNASHWIGSHNVLFEGNWTFQASSDPVWGPSILNTFFKNDVTGFRTPFFNPYQSFTINDAASIPGFFPQNGLLCSLLRGTTIGSHSSAMSLAPPAPWQDGRFKAAHRCFVWVDAQPVAFVV